MEFTRFHKTMTGGRSLNSNCCDEINLGQGGEWFMVSRKLIAYLRIMSRGFVKEDDQEEAPFVPPRASLPPGVENYVTQEGYDALVLERENFVQAKKQNHTLSEKERRRANTVIDAQISMLDARIMSARVVTENNSDNSEVRFGCVVKFAPISNRNDIKTFKIVGVDEANIRQSKVSFTAPIVKAMIGKSINEKFEFQQEAQSKGFIVLSID